jgi:glycosyltransferase domain-containing protein
MKKNFNVTILLTIYNRVNYTNKWLDFVEQGKIPFKIFISDGGNIVNIKKKLRLKKRKLNITYKKFKYYKNYNHFYQKFYESVKKIDTKYIFIADDDDYVFSNSIIKSARFLDKNKNYSCAKGINCLGELIRNNNKVLGLALRDEGKKKYKSISSNIPDLRLIEYYKKKHLSVYNGLHKKNSLLKTFKILNSKNFFNLFVTELIFCLSVIYNGKIARMSHIDYIKMDNTNQSSSYNFFLLRPFSLISKSKDFSKENNLIFKFLNFNNKKNKKTFNFLNHQAVENDRVLRIEEENNNDTFFKKFRLIIKNILIEMKLYYVIKYFYLKLFKSNYFYKRVVVFDKSLIKTVKKDINSFVKIVEFNKNYKF